jgi:hypothetical protein
MAAVDFGQRPVAGLAGCIELLHKPRAGQALELAAELEHVDADSVDYSGIARVDETPAICLRDRVGPVMPLADFDDPQALRARFEKLCSGGAGSGSLPGLTQLPFERTGENAGRRVSASFKEPSEAPLFADHFPRRPVFPGGLLMHLNLQFAEVVADEMPPPRGVGGCRLPFGI